ncbi:MAG: cobalamin-dependent protein [Endomicrobiales bacterium]
MTKILLVALPMLRYRQPLLGLGYIGASLVQKGHEVSLYTVGNDVESDEGFDALVRRFKPDYMGVSILTAQYADAVKIIERAKKMAPEMITVAGGPHVSALAEHTLTSIPQLDYVIRGEGEHAFCDLIEARAVNGSLEKVSGLAYRVTGSVRINATVCIEAIDDLPYPWKVIEPLSYNTRELHGYTCRHRPVVAVLSSRGCPYLCTFCAQQTVFGHGIRVRNPVKFVDELEYLHRQHGIREFHFADDNFTFYPDHARAVCEEIIARKLTVSWALINGIRADRVDEPLLRLMKKAGCYYTAFGLESGSVATLKQYKKSLDVNKVYDTVKIANKLGYITQGFFLIAPPFETEQDLAATLSLIRALPLDRIAIGVPIPYPGTELFSYYQAKGFLTDLSAIHWEDFAWGKFPYFWEHLSAEKVESTLRTAMKIVYADPVRMMKFMLKLRTIEQYRITFAGFYEWMVHVVGKIGALHEKDTAR